MAAAGPAANLLLLVVCGIAIKSGIRTHIFFQPNSVDFTRIVEPGSGKFWAGLATFLSMMFSLNLIMLVLNLLPLPPLGGSGIANLFLPGNTARTYWRIVSNPGFAFIGLLIAWRIIDPLINIVFPWFMNILYWGAHYY